MDEEETKQMADRFAEFVKDLVDQSGLSPQQTAILLLGHVANGGFQCNTEEEAKAEAEFLFAAVRRH